MSHRKNYHFSVNTITDRDLLDYTVRFEGLTCYVVQEQRTYELRGGIDNIDWSIVTTNPLYFSNTPPTVNDDKTQGFTEGSIWIVKNPNPWSAQRGAWLLYDADVNGDAQWLLLQEFEDIYGQYCVGISFGDTENFPTLQDAINAGSRIIYAGGFFDEALTWTEGGFGLQLYSNPSYGLNIVDWAGHNAPLLDIQAGLSHDLQNVNFEQNSSFPVIQLNNIGGLNYKNVFPSRWMTGIVKRGAGTNPAISLLNAGELNLDGVRFIGWPTYMIDSVGAEHRIERCTFICEWNVQSCMRFTGNALIKNCKVNLTGDNFQNIIDINGDGIIRCIDFVIEALLNRAFNFTNLASNAELSLSGCVVSDSPAHNWDIFVDPAAANVKIRVDDTIMDDTKLSLIGSTDAIGAFLSNAAGANQRAYLGRNYTPANLANWTALDPVTIANALDRIAAALGPIA